MSFLEQILESTEKDQEAGVTIPMSSLELGRESTSKGSSSAALVGLILMNQTLAQKLRAHAGGPRAIGRILSGPQRSVYLGKL